MGGRSPRPRGLITAQTLGLRLPSSASARPAPEGGRLHYRGLNPSGYLNRRETSLEELPACMRRRGIQGRPASGTRCVAAGQPRLSDAFEEVGRADAQRFGQVAETLVKQAASSLLYIDEDVSGNSGLRGEFHLREPALCSQLNDPSPECASPLLPNFHSFGVVLTGAGRHLLKLAGAPAGQAHQNCVPDQHAPIPHGRAPSCTTSCRRQVRPR